MRIFLDVDGVLSDWTGTVHRAMGQPYSPYSWPYAYGPDGWHWHNEIGWSFEAVSDLCGYDLWAEALLTTDGRHILDNVRRYGDITLLTTPMPNVMSASGKMAWIERNYTEFKRHVLIATEKKAVLAGVPDAILVDDGECNVRDWQAAGGRAVLVPRWWNRLHPYTLNAPWHVQHQLEELCPET
jgi:hypothetical protein